MPDFKGYLSDLGGPSANMYGMARALRRRGIPPGRHRPRPAGGAPRLAGRMAQGATGFDRILFLFCGIFLLSKSLKSMKHEEKEK